MSYISLKKFEWVLLKNQDSIRYDMPRYLNRFLNEYLDTYTIEQKFMELDPNFKEIRRLKELYIHFNSEYIGNPEDAGSALDRLIEIYAASPIRLFHEMAELMKDKRTEIINSFSTVESCNKSTLSVQLSRISNGPMESWNNISKDLKRTANGLSNFAFNRNRILFSSRSNSAPLAVPKKIEEVRTVTGKKRGPYNKKSKE